MTDSAPDVGSGSRAGIRQRASGRQENRFLRTMRRLRPSIAPSYKKGGRLALSRVFCRAAAPTRSSATCWRGLICETLHASGKAVVSRLSPVNAAARGLRRARQGEEPSIGGSRVMFFQLRASCCNPFPSRSSCIARNAETLLPLPTLDTQPIRCLANNWNLTRSLAEGGHQRCSGNRRSTVALRSLASTREPNAASAISDGDGAP